MTGGQARPEWHCGDRRRGRVGNGQCAFFYTEARSNLAPASTFNVDNEFPFLVREDLVTHTIVVASVQPGGQPIGALDPESSGDVPRLGGILLTNFSGNAVGFTAVDGEAMVHNFVTNVSWQVGERIGGISIRCGTTRPIGLSTGEAPESIRECTSGRLADQADPCGLSLCRCWHGGA